MRKLWDFVMVRSPSKVKMLSNDDQLLTHNRRRRPQSEIIRIVCILLAIIFFVTIALGTTLSILGVMKTIYIWALLTTDINEEQTLISGSKHHANSNILKLNKSLDRETMYSSLCLIVSGFGFQLTCACAVLLYGLLMNKIQAIYAWIIFSCTNVCCLGILMFFLDRFTRMPLDGKGIDLFLETFTVATVTFNLLLYYHTKTLLESDRKKIIVKAYGGYTHTVSPGLNPADNNNKIPMGGNFMV